MANRWKVRCVHCKKILPGNTTFRGTEITLFCACGKLIVKGNSWSTRIHAKKEDFDILTDRRTA